MRDKNRIYVPEACTGQDMFSPPSLRVKRLRSPCEEPRDRLHFGARGFTEEGRILNASHHRATGQQNEDILGISPTAVTVGSTLNLSGEEVSRFSSCGRPPCPVRVVGCWPLPSNTPQLPRELDEQAIYRLLVSWRLRLLLYESDRMVGRREP